LDSGVILRGITVKYGVLRELVFVQNPVREIGCDQDIDIEIDKGENAFLETHRSIDVAVEVSQLARRFAKAKDAVPTVSPEELRADGAFDNCPEEWMFDFVGEGAFEND
jgi:hypothetical protein